MEGLNTYILHIPKEFIKLMEYISAGSFKVWEEDLKYCVENRYYPYILTSSFINNLNRTFKEKNYAAAIISIDIEKTNNLERWKFIYDNIKTIDCTNLSFFNEQ